MGEVIFRITAPPVDYRALLIKYITHVMTEEGCTFIRNGRRNADRLFSEEEWDELVRLNDEAD